MSKTRAWIVAAILIVGFGIVGQMDYEEEARKEAA